MDKMRTAMGLFVGIILGIACGIGFKSIAVGFITAACFAVLFMFIFNQYRRE